MDRRWIVDGSCSVPGYSSPPAVNVCVLVPKLIPTWNPAMNLSMSTTTPALNPGITSAWNDTLFETCFKEYKTK